MTVHNEPKYYIGFHDLYIMHNVMLMLQKHIGLW